MKRLIAVAALAAFTLPGCAEARTRLSGAGVDIRSHMDYDEYMGRITENSMAKQQQEQQQV